MSTLARTLAERDPLVHPFQRMPPTQLMVAAQGMGPFQGIPLTGVQWLMRRDSPCGMHIPISSNCGIHIAISSNCGMRGVIAEPHL